MTMTTTTPHVESPLDTATVARLLELAADRAENPMAAGRGFGPADWIQLTVQDACTVGHPCGLAVDPGRTATRYASRCIVEAAAATVTDECPSAHKMLDDWARPRPARSRRDVADLLRRAARRSKGL